MAKVEQLIQRDDGSELKIVAQEMFGAGLARSVDVYVLSRPDGKSPWEVLSDRPAANWREMSVQEYIDGGRSPMLQSVTPGQILAVVHELEKISAQSNVQNQGPTDTAPTRESSLSSEVNDSADFKAWFGQSKIVDEHGQPLTVYHGTDKAFESFSLDQLGRNTGFENTQLGFYFVADKTVAEHFASETSGGTNVVQAYLRIQKPLDLTIQGIFNNKDQAPTLWEAISQERLSPDQALESINEEIGLGEVAEMYEVLSSPQFKQIAQRDGYDGVISDFGAGYLQYCVFDATQIKVVAHLSHDQALVEPIKQTGQFLLLIGNNWSYRVPSLAHAVQVFSRLRDASGQGASSFPDGRILGSSTLLRISYNGRVWNGDQPVPVDERALNDGEDSSVAEVLRHIDEEKAQMRAAAARPRMQ